MCAPTPLDKTDPNLKDATGYNLEIGASGKFGDQFTYDITLFQILYDNRIGSIVLNDNAGQAYIYKTNTGTSRTSGIELYAEWRPLSIERQNMFNLSIFTATSYFDAVYTKGKAVINGKTEGFVGNRLETTPHWTSRNGLQLSKNGFSATLQCLVI